MPGHIHFEISATGFAPKILEIVCGAGQSGRVTERIVLERR